MLTMKEIQQLLPQLYQSFSIPLLVYSTEQTEEVFVFPNNPVYKELLMPYQKLFKNMKQPVHYYLNELFYTVACFWNEEKGYKLILGPVPSTLVSKSTARALLYETNLTFSDQIAQEVFNLPIYQQGRLLNIFSLLCQTILNKRILPLEITNIINNQVSIPITEKKTEGFFQSSEHQSFHSTWEFEKRLLSYVREGNVAKLKSLIDNPENIDAGIIADDNLRQIKNLYIASTTLAIRAAIEGGLEPEIAYQFSDLVIWEMEKLTNFEAIMKWQQSSLIELTQKVAALKTGKTVSALVHQIFNYIATHINEPLTVNSLAHALYQNRSYLSRMFKKEMGKNLSDYIIERKLLEAKDLLRFSNRSISDISNFLAFSSQSYFQTVFKKKYGITPLQYRKQENSYTST
ncbi:AraC family transcriptional regulator [Streptococcus parasanguinis]|uniref:helix-turn-helix domain-containing protein n=1 Tax=Streptococcus parasanguinis TaxID=1318 RepID=UPI00352F746C